MRIAFGPQSKEEVKKAAIEFLKSPNTRAKRRKMSHVQVAVDPLRRNRPHARVGGLKPVKRPEQLAIEFRRAQRAELLKIQIHRILPECAELRFILGATKIRNVWALSQAPTEVIARIPGLGPTRAGKLHAYLVGKGIPVAWSPNVRFVR